MSIENKEQISTLELDLLLLEISSRLYSMKNEKYNLEQEILTSRADVDVASVKRDRKDVISRAIIALVEIQECLKKGKDIHKNLEELRKWGIWNG